MPKTSLAIDQILQLDAEINGFVNPQNQEVIFEGFMKQPLPIILKYELKEFSDKLKDERSKVDSLRNELIEKFGEKTEDGSTQISPTIEENGEEVRNPKYINFIEEYNKLLHKEVELDHPEITKEDLKDAGKSKDQYDILFKLVKKD
jgi:arginine deiminase